MRASCCQRPRRAGQQVARISALEAGAAAAGVAFDQDVRNFRIRGSLDPQNAPASVRTRDVLRPASAAPARRVPSQAISIPVGVFWRKISIE